MGGPFEESGQFTTVENTDKRIGASDSASVAAVESGSAAGAGNLVISGGNIEGGSLAALEAIKTVGDIVNSQANSTVATRQLDASVLSTIAQQNANLTQSTVDSLAKLGQTQILSGFDNRQKLFVYGGIGLLVLVAILAWLKRKL